MGGNVIVQFYLHAPGRFVFALVIVVPVLAAAGLDAWRETKSSRARVQMLLPGLFVWGALPLILGLHRTHPALPAAGLLLAAAFLSLLAIRPAAALLIPILLAGELGVNGLTGQSIDPPVAPQAAAGAPQRQLSGFAPLERPAVRAADYTMPGAIGRSLQSRTGRFLSLAPRLWTPLGYHVLQRRDQWGLMGTQRSMIFGLGEGQGYDSVQVLRYWKFVRASDPKPIRYNAAGFIHVSPVILDLLQVTSLIQPAGNPSIVPDTIPVATEGTWRLDAVPNPRAAATVISSWTSVTSSDEALRAVLAPGFDPDTTVVVERDPGLGAPSASPGGSARYIAEGPQAARVEVATTSPGLVLVRTVYDPGWTARVDGRPTPVLPADALVQAVPVPAGRHTIELAYRDPSIGFGILGSALSLATLLGLAFGLLVRDRRATARVRIA
jgi:hypothetical protein